MVSELETFVKNLYDNAVFIGSLRMKLEEFSPDEVCFSLETSPELHANVHNTTHGGVLMSFADTAMGAICAFNNKKVVTINIQMSFFAPVPLNEKIYVRAHLLHNGRKTITAEAEITDANGRLTNKAGAAFFVLGSWLDV